MIKIILNKDIKRRSAMAVLPFIILEKSKKFSKDTINHEKIHIRQQLDLLPISWLTNSIVILSLTDSYWWLLLNLLPFLNSSVFYMLYIVNYFINKFRYEGHSKEYRNIIFEREAFENDNNYNYLNKRKATDVLKYWKSKEKRS